MLYSGIFLKYIPQASPREDCEYWFHNVQDLVSDQSGQLRWKVHEVRMESESIIISCFALTTSCGVYIRLKTPSVCLSILLQTEKPWRCATTGGLAQWEQQTLAEVFRLRVGRSGAEPNDQKPDYSVYQFLCVLCIQCMFVISIETGFCYPSTMIVNINEYYELSIVWIFRYL